MKCENCPAGWEDRTYEGECNDCGCLIMGHDMVGDDCSLSRSEVEKRLQQLEDYHAGKIKRPQWLANRFMREMDHAAALYQCHLGLPGFPPKTTHDNLYYSLYGSTDLHFQGECEHRHGFDQAKNAALEILNAELEDIKKRELSMVPEPMICASIGSQKAVVMRLIGMVKDIHKISQTEA